MGDTTASRAGVTTVSAVEFVAEGSAADRICGLLAVDACREITTNRIAAAAAPATATEGQRRAAGVGTGAALTSRFAFTNSDRHWTQSAT